jgi:hypothetical protein
MDGPVLALRDILNTLNRQVALGGEADIKGRAALAGSVAIDPTRTFGQQRPGKLPETQSGQMSRMLSMLVPR